MSLVLKADPKPRPAWYWFISWLARRVAFGLLGGTTVKGAENVPRSGPVLMASVHFSHLDPPLIGATSPRMLRFMAKEGLFRVPLLGPLIRSVGAFPVRRGETDTSAVRKTLAWLAEGEAVLVFPEGRRGDGQRMGPIQSGIAMLARRSGALIVPVGLCGTHKMLPRGRSRIRRGRAVVVYGKPFSYAEVACTGNEKSDREAFARHLAQRIAEVTAEAGMPVRTAD